MLRRRRNKVNKFSIPSKLVKLIAWLTSLFVSLIIVVALGFIILWSRVDYRNYIHLNLVIQRPEVESSQVLLLDIQNKKLTKIHIPNSLEVPVAGGYGWYRVGVLSGLSLQEKKNYSLIQQSLSQWLGINLTASIMISGTDEISFSDWIWAKSDISMIERLWIAYSLRSMHENTVNVDINNYLATQNNQLVLDSRQRNKLVSDNIFYSNIAQVQTQISLVNATDISGLATLAVDTLRPLGYDVVNLRNQQAESSVTAIYIDDSAVIESEYLRPIIELLPHEVEIIRQPTLETYRADVVIKLGYDYFGLVRSQLQAR